MTNVLARPGPPRAPMRSLPALLRGLRALARANVRYWTTVAPVVRRELARWEARAGAIDDPSRRALALFKLRAERFNPRLAATLATLAPRSRRRAVAEAIVALQVAYDYLDALGERGRDAERDGYAFALLTAVEGLLAGLPAAGAVSETALLAALRCAGAQARGHAAGRGPGMRELERWASAQATPTGLGWPEWLAGAQASVLCLHALIAAAADPATTSADARALDDLYLRIGALTMLDGLIDRDRDRAAGAAGELVGGALDYAALYPSAEQMGARLAAVAAAAADAARGVPHSAHHVMTLTGVVAHYACAPAARERDAEPVFAHLREQLGGVLDPTLVVMRTWRFSERLIAVVLGVAALFAGAAGAGAVPAPRAHAARALKATGTARLHYVSASGSLLFEEGRVSGTLPGTMTAHMLVGAKFSGSFTFHVSGGTIRGHGSATPKGSGVYESFAGSLVASGGSGRYRSAHGSARLYGTFNRDTYGLVIQTVGTLYY